MTRPILSPCHRQHSFQYYLVEIDKSKYIDSFSTAGMAKIGEMEPCVVDGKPSMKQVTNKKHIG